MTKRLLTSVLVVTSLLAAPAAPSQWRPAGGPMRIVLLVDSSAAVSAMLTSFRAGLNSFLDALPGEPEIAIISTGSQLRVRVGPTSDRMKLHAAASGFSSDGGGNAFLDTLLEADKRFLKNVPDQRPVFVILTTDAGATVESTRTDAYNIFVNDFLARGGRAHAIIITGINSGTTTLIARNLTHNTGGFDETVGIDTAVPPLMRVVAEHVAADQ